MLPSLPGRGRCPCRRTSATRARHRTRTGVLVAALAAAACSGNSDPTAGVDAGATVGAQGGVVAATTGPLAGTSVAFPPAALPGPTTVAIRVDQPTPTTGLIAVGPAARLDPAGLQPAVPARLSLPFDPALVPPGTADADFAIVVRAADGSRSELSPLELDRAQGRVVADLPRLGTCWAAVPDAVDLRDYFPRDDGDHYEFDTALSLDVIATTTAPTFAGVPLHALSFAFLGHPIGFYMRDDPDGALVLAGEFDRLFDDLHERLDGPATLLGPRPTIGGEQRAFYSFLGFRPFGTAQSSYLGTAATGSVLRERTAVTTPAGHFDDVVLWVWAVDRRDSRPRALFRVLRVWLARGIGPVQVQLDDSCVHRLIATNR